MVHVLAPFRGHRVTADGGNKGSKAAVNRATFDARRGRRYLQRGLAELARGGELGDVVLGTRVHHVSTDGIFLVR
jgi:hypothetical protein